MFEREAGWRGARPGRQVDTGTRRGVVPHHQRNRQVHASSSTVFRRAPPLEQLHLPTALPVPPGGPSAIYPRWICGKYILSGSLES
jgi:hypothetical protein